MYTYTGIASEDQALVSKVSLCYISKGTRKIKLKNLFITQAVLDTVHVTNFVQSRHCRWRTDSFSFVRVGSSIFFAFRSLTSGVRLYFLEKFE